MATTGTPLQRRFKSLTKHFALDIPSISAQMAMCLALPYSAGPCILSIGLYFFTGVLLPAPVYFLSSFSCALKAFGCPGLTAVFFSPPVPCPFDGALYPVLFG
jgi:hypothetical protein